jgi:hypothetical protein
VLVEDDVHNALHLLELHRVQGARHFDISVTFARYLEGKARAGKIRQSDVEVTDIAVVMCWTSAMGGFRSFPGTRSGDKVAPIPVIRSNGAQLVHST